MGFVGGIPSDITLTGNTLSDPEDHTQPDATSGSRVLGLDATKVITLDGQRLQNARK